MYLPLLLLLPPLAYFVRWLLTPVLSSMSDPPAHSYRHEFVSAPGATDAAPFPSLFDAASKHVSFVLPAYNEEERLHPTMQRTMSYLKRRREALGDAFTYEVIIVDDGSKDRTSEVALGYVKQHGTDTVRLLRLAANQGKGGAVQQGALHARGEYVLMMDADGATELEDYARVEERLRDFENAEGHGVAVGSRAHLEDEAAATRKWYRTVLMHGFHFAVATLCVRSIRDTQCGFKLFTRRSARALFYNQKLRRWSFDVELLFLAEQMGIPLVEVGVNWEEVPGSKLDLFWSSLQMGRDLLVIRFAYLLGVWRVADPEKAD